MQKRRQEEFVNMERCRASQCTQNKNLRAPMYQNYAKRLHRRRYYYMDDDHIDHENTDDKTTYNYSMPTRQERGEDATDS